MLPCNVQHWPTGQAIVSVKSFQRPSDPSGLGDTVSVDEGKIFALRHAGSKVARMAGKNRCRASIEHNIGVLLGYPFGAVVARRVDDNYLDRDPEMLLVE